jgi:hypothetical protein
LFNRSKYQLKKEDFPSLSLVTSSSLASGTILAKWSFIKQTVSCGGVKPRSVPKKAVVLLGIFQICILLNHSTLLSKENAS